MAFERNPGTEFRLDWIEDIYVNRSAAERRAATIGTRRTVKNEWQIGWLLKAITLIDLTTLSGDDTPSNVKRLCAKAKRPVREDILKAVGFSDRPITTAAVCVYHSLVPTAVEELRGSPVKVAAVSTGFPAGLSPLEARLEEVRSSVREGASEIDVVIQRGLVLRNEWKRLYDEVRAMREAAGHAHLKAILATGELATLRNVAKASWVCMMGGADFIKTSTGKEAINATLPASLVMIRSIRAYAERTGYLVGFKPAGGIRSARQALEYMYLVCEELGREWLEPHLFRFGASALLSDIERQLEYHVTGRYAAFHRQPMI
ncbi:MAG: deoxyribose-phosphate aldolase [Sandaracinaceae bacterium]|nr:deoxyribose-phosphate aldolase [Sandaracinaceae bacterium]